MNIGDFAKKAGFSTATVSRAFHEPDKVSAKTRDTILALAAKLKYYPDPSGRALAQGRHDVLGLIWPLEVEGSGALFAHRVLASLTRQLIRNDLDLLICPVDRGDFHNLEHARRTLLRSRCDAWVLMYPRHEDVLVEPLRRSGKPVICLMGNVGARLGWKYVCLDQSSWIEDAMTRLKAAEVRRAIFLGGRENEPDHKERLLAFQRLARTYFRSAAEAVPGWPPDIHRLLELISRREMAGIIAADDNAALMALESCRQAGLRVPEDVRIVGIDDSPASRASKPALATYRQPLDEMVACAVDLATGKAARSRLFHAKFAGGETLG